jgi:hypothetical protein
MKYFLDTEFIEDGKTIDLVSIGIVAEDGRELYLLNAFCNHDKANDWVQENVLKYLPKKHKVPHYIFTLPANLYGQYLSTGLIAKAVKDFCDPSEYGEPEFWGYYSDYDWVVFCQLFGTMMDLPLGFPMYCRDIKQLADSFANPNLPEQKTGEHNALEDARWNKQAYDHLSAIARKYL